MFCGAPVKSLDDIKRLRSAGFDFGEIAIANAGARRMWWESGIINGGMGKFFLMAHGPLEDDPYDSANLWNRYLPNLMATVDTLSRMSIHSLNIHFLMDSRFVSGIVLAEKRGVLAELVQYAGKNSVVINLENLSETAEDIEPVLDEVPHLGMTLDVGHANLYCSQNKSLSFIEKLGKSIRHVHLHDNFGGDSPKADLHLPIGEGNVDFGSILNALLSTGYDRTITLEVKPEFQETTKADIQKILSEI
ncbi:MAG: sugar phosphate isomerase/epimerase [Desulfomonilaceae bacterium]|jgi:sugar phosphate isomerase/epimerase